jgi:hypothetical protein
MLFKKKNGHKTSLECAISDQITVLRCACWVYGRRLGEYRPLNKVDERPVLLNEQA